MFDIAAIDAKAGAPTRKELAHELCSVLNAELCLNGIPIPQITSGRLALLDAIESPIISDKKYTPHNVDVAMFIMMMGQDSINSIAAKIYDPKASLKKDLKKLTDRLGDYPRDHAVAYIRQSFSVATEGFLMIPGKESDGDSEITFGAEWIAFYVSSICPAVGMDMDAVLWKLSLAAGGFILASLARQDGVKNVQRKLDDKAMLEEIGRQIKAEKDKNNG